MPDSWTETSLIDCCEELSRCSLATGCARGGEARNPRRLLGGHDGGRGAVGTRNLTETQTTKLEEILNFTERARSIPTFSDICFTKRDAHDVMSMAYGTRLCQQFFAQIAPLSFPHTLLLSGRMLKASPPKSVFSHFLFHHPTKPSVLSVSWKSSFDVKTRTHSEVRFGGLATPQHPQGLKTSTIHPQRVPPYDRRCARLCAQAVGVACLVP